MSTELLIEYDATLDTRQRFVVKGIPKCKHYHVRVYSGKKGGYTLEMQPQALVDLDQISLKTLRVMDKSMKNLAKGVVGKPIDLEGLKRYVNTKE